jgi:NAD-reducing hydrogenase small subunit
MERLKLATVWLGGCSGCHMSFLDLDEWLFDLAARVELAYSPLADRKQYPEGVDLALVEGAVANEDHLEQIRAVRARSRTLIAFGDCAVTGNVTALRNPLGDPILLLQQVYGTSAGRQDVLPSEAWIVPALLERVLPVHAVVHVDLYLPGCPPSASRIKAVVETLLEGRPPDLSGRDLLSYG